MAARLLSRIPNKRLLIGQGMAGLGIVRALEAFARLRGPALLTLIYHRIAEPAGDPYYEPVISATPEAFRAQMRMIRDRYRVLRLDEVPRSDEEEEFKSVTGPSVLISFDDGYRDNAEVAAPILRELGIPAAFFLTTDFVDGKSLPWWDHVSYVIKRTEQPTLTLDEGLAPTLESLSVDLGDGSRAARTSAIMTIIGAFLEGRVADEARLLAQLGRLAEVPVDVRILGRSLFMTWDQARALAGDGGLFAIGSHTVSHRRLAALSEAEQRGELVESKRILETRIGPEVDTIAYPYGGANAFDNRTERIATKSGYRLGFSAINGIDRADKWNSSKIHRLMIGSGDTAPLLRARLALLAAVGSSSL